MDEYTGYRVPLLSKLTMFEGCLYALRMDVIIILG